MGRRGLETSRECWTITQKYYEQTWNAKKAGAPVAWVTSNTPVEILFAMGIHVMYPENYAAICQSQKRVRGYYNVALAEGFSEQLCSYARANLGYVLSPEAEEAPLGGMPLPDFVITTSGACDTHLKWFENVADILGCPIFVLDVPYNYLPMEQAFPKGDWVEQYVQQCYQLISFLEDITGTNFSWDQLLRSIEFSGEAGALWDRINLSRRYTPAPMSARDAFSIMYPIVGLTGLPVTAEYYRRVLEEVTSKVERHEGVGKSERYRLLFDGIPFWYNLRFFTESQNDGAVFVADTYSITWCAGTLDNEHPFESLARKYMMHWFNRNLEKRIEVVLELARDYSIDGAVLLANSSCRPYLIGEHEISEALQKQGVPSVIIEADHGDEDKYSEAQAKTRVVALLESIDQQKR